MFSTNRVSYYNHNICQNNCNMRHPATLHITKKGFQTKL